MNCTACTAHSAAYQARVELGPFAAKTVALRDEAFSLTHTGCQFDPTAWANPANHLVTF